MKRSLFYIKASHLALLLALMGGVLAGCNFPGRGSATPTGELPDPAVSAGLTPGAQTPGGGELPAASPSPAEPTTPPVPLALRVNGYPVTVAEYEAEVAVYLQAKSGDLSAEDRQRVLAELIDSALLAQAAEAQDHPLDEAALQARYDALAQQSGGAAALEAWIVAHAYSAESFRLALRRSALAAWMRDQIAAEVPAAIEQVHVRQILLYNASTATDVLLQLRAGNSFENLALKYDPTTRGDLGWFPRGYLNDKKLEEAAFALQPLAFSDIVQTAAGYHIVQLLERESQRLLSPEARLTLQTLAVQQWLQAQRDQAQIEVLLP